MNRDWLIQWITQGLLRAHLTCLQRTPVTPSPLTPALSPLRGEGVALDARRNSFVRCRAQGVSEVLGPNSQEATSAELGIGLIQDVRRAPSPFNGERAGVRGEFGAEGCMLKTENCSGMLRQVFLALLVCMTVGQHCHAAEWRTEPGHRSLALQVAPGGGPGFRPMPESSTGIAFTNLLPQARHLTNQVLLNGSGLAAGDVDGDGWCDLYLCSLGRPNALYRNLGNWKFTDIAAEAGVACAGLTSSGAALVDLDGDGDLDLVVNTVGHGTRVFLNDGKAHFAELAVLNNNKAGMSLALGDLDGDGFLDLYVANYRTRALMDMPNTEFNFAVRNGKRVISRVNGRPVSDPEFANRYRVGPKGGIEEDGEVDEIYRNVGGRSFVPLSFTNGTFLDETGQPLASPPFDWGLSVMIRDLNQDGLPDIWVCNDFDSPERIWLNQGGGKFRAAPRLAFRKSSHFSMGIDVADINRDGLDDIFVVDMLSRDHVMRMDMQGDRNPPTPLPGMFANRPDYMVNTLFLNRGDGTYAEVAQLAGLNATEWSWTPLFLDVDLDGFEDLLIANGHERAARSLDVSEKLRALREGRQLAREQIFENRKMFPRQNSPNLAFRNRGDLTFEDMSEAWGFNFNGVSHGMAVADFDNDGDLDVVVNNLNDACSVYRNHSSAPRLAVRLKGSPPNTRGIGARIKITGGAVPTQNQEMLCGGRYLSSDDPMRVFAAGSPTNEMTVEVTWRSGKRSVVRGVRANHLYEIEEPAGDLTSLNRLAPRASNLTPLFIDVSSLIAHAHTDERFDDFARQPLLPNQLSQLGPGVSWCDLDGDGWEDILIGGGKGGQVAAYRNDQRGGFQRVKEPMLDQTLGRDLATILPWRNKSGDRVLLAGQANYEDKATDVAVVRELNLTKHTAGETLPGSTSSTGPLALADIDGDGQLDLLVGGRVVGARWPEPASSLVLRGAGDRFVQDDANSAALSSVGLVSGAVFSDLDGDGDPDLVLACEWGSLKIFRNDKGRLVPWDWRIKTPNSQLSTLSHLTGWWNGVTAADFDGDGRLDLAASNWGRNTPYEGHRGKPLQLFHADFNGDGLVEVIEAHHDPATQRLVPERQLDFLAKAMPVLRTRFSSHMTFGRSSLQEILADQWAAAQRLEAIWLESTVFLNRGDHFEVRWLPIEAQMAPAFGLCAQDFDGDGHEDLFLSQNFFCVQPDTPRYDGGRGLLLRGDGRGGFAAVPGQEGGLTIYGEQRGAAAGDFDHDGRVDLVVSQNGAETKLYRNASARPGLRVRLIGTAGNADGVGAVLRLMSGDQAGPVREIHAGSGYWSQDGTVQVMSPPGQPPKLQVRWPCSSTTTADVPDGAREVSMDTSGKLTVVR